jgi:DNA-binding XRE family transcriptional regulator
MNTKNKKLKVYKFDEIKDEFIGKKGTLARDKYEFELKIDLLGEMVKKIRLERSLTQEQLGKLVGVQKAQISKIENGLNNVTVETMLKVFSALQAKVIFNVLFKKKL